MVGFTNIEQEDKYDDKIRVYHGDESEYSDISPEIKKMRIVNDETLQIKVNGNEGAKYLADDLQKSGITETEITFRENTNTVFIPIEKDRNRVTDVALELANQEMIPLKDANQIIDKEHKTQLIPPQELFKITEKYGYQDVEFTNEKYPIEELQGQDGNTRIYPRGGKFNKVKEMIGDNANVVNEKAGFISVEGTTREATVTLAKNGIIPNCVNEAVQEHANSLLPDLKDIISYKGAVETGDKVTINAGQGKDTGGRTV